MSTAGNIVLGAGAITFVNTWVQRPQSSSTAGLWRIPIATLLGMGMFNVFAKLDDRAATGLAVIVIMGSLFIVPPGGRSAAAEFSGLFGGKR